MFLSFFGCATTQISSREYVSQHPELSDSLKNTILNNKVHIGMTKEQVRASWGEPDEINKTILKDSTHEQWCYGNYNFLYFKDDILEAAQQ